VVKRILSSSYIYEQFQNMMGVKCARKSLAKNYRKLSGGEKVVDLVCGSGTALDHLPQDITYVGFDISEDYIAAARQRLDKRAKFTVSSARQLLKAPDPRLSGFDLILSNGLITSFG
jgi:ubiquinone/menaquinone biosynthesis C-methylase UbiE